MAEYDVAIIGAGPAGMTAAIYAARANLSVLMLDKLAPGGQIVNTFEVQNYTGMGSINGAELAIRSGAWDYIEKPASLPMMTLPIIRALQYRETKKQKSNLKSLFRPKFIVFQVVIDAQLIITTGHRILDCLYRNGHLALFTCRNIGESQCPGLNLFSVAKQCP